MLLNRATVHLDCLGAESLQRPRAQSSPPAADPYYDDPVGIVYLAALIVGLGVLGIGILLPGGDADGADAGDAGDLDVDVDVDMDAAGGGHAHAGHGHAADMGAIAIFLSLRFWSYALMGFGLVGTGLHFLGLAGSLVTLILAIGVGLLSGLIASATFRALSRAETSSGGEARDAVGQIGRVLLPLGSGKRGKIRIQVRGQLVDLLASTDDAELAEGTEVLVEEIRGTVAHVSRVPPELLPR